MKNITRTSYYTFANVKVYYPDTDDIRESLTELDGKHDVDSFKAKFATINDSAIVLKVSGLEVKEELRGMSEADFIKYGTPFAERGKDNRGMVSKTITATKYAVKVYDHNDDTIKDTIVTVDSEKSIVKNLPTNYQLLKVLSSEKVNTLVCMPLEAFNKYSRPMVDHFHYAD